MSKATFVFAHGAGADSKSEFMTEMAALITSNDIDVITFDFPYMLRRQQSGKKSPPDRMPKLEQAYIEQVTALKKDNLFIGGKSMGGRVATMVAEQLGVSGVICFGYPFHPPGKPKNTRTAHLKQLSIPTLILQGTRDTFGKPEEVNGYLLSENINIQWLQDGNHSLETLKRSELTSEATWQLAAQQAKKFIRSISR